MSALLQSYESPSAAFDPAERDELRATVIALDTLLESTQIASRLTGVLEQLVVEAQTGADAGGPARGGAPTFEADGYVRVTRICDGWTVPAVPDANANGELRLTATFSESGLDPVTWGTVRQCRYLPGGMRLELWQVEGSDHALSVYWGPGVRVGTLGSRSLLVSLGLQGTLAGEPLDLGFDFRILPGQGIEYRIRRGSDSLIASLSAADTLTLRASNGDFVCRAGAGCTQLGADGGGGG